MSTTAHITVVVITLASLVFVIRLVRRRALASKYSLLWLLISAAMVVLAVFPGAADEAADAVGVDYPPAAYLGVAVAFLFVVIVQYSWELSRLEDRTRVLAEEVALLRESVRRLAEPAPASDRTEPRDG